MPDDDDTKASIHHATPLPLHPHPKKARTHPPRLAPCGGGVASAGTGVAAQHLSGGRQVVQEAAGPAVGGVDGAEEAEGLGEELADGGRL